LYKPVFSQQQDERLGTWNVFNIKYNINKKWSFFAEAQLRSLKFYDHFHYHEYKGCINYNITPELRLSLGAGDYDTYLEGGNFVTPKKNDEFRLWPQVMLTQPLGIFQIEQRFRSEFRFTSNGFRNRFRYRLGIIYPFGKEKKGYTPYMVSLSNELFLTNRAPYFERNRIQLAFNYRTSKVTTLQIGYLHQFDYQIEDETGTDFFQIGLFLEFSRFTKGPKSNNRIIKGD
ncbi:MAG: DUF2490 domain-containing protein, partial [Chitinophagaceae bacterium]